MTRPGGRRASSTAFAATSVLVVANVSRPVVPGGLWHAATAVAMLLVARWGGLGVGDLGLSRDRVRDGLRLGGLVFVSISAVVVAGGFLGVVQDDRVDVSAGELALRVLVIIPLGTVLVEELAFRGVLHGALHRALPARVALGTGAILFGLWHVLPAATGGGITAGDPSPVLLAGGTFAATAVAGVGFEWLRTRSDSLVAPMLAHLATNSVTYAVAWAFR